MSALTLLGALVMLDGDGQHAQLFGGMLILDLGKTGVISSFPIVTFPRNVSFRRRRPDISVRGDA